VFSALGDFEKFGFQFVGQFQDSLILWINAERRAIDQRVREGVRT